MTLYLNVEKTVAEGAGAAALAAVLADPGRYRGRRVGLVLSGGNIDPNLLAAVILRDLVRQNRIVSMRMTMPDRPGYLARISQTVVGPRGQRPAGGPPSPVRQPAGAVGDAGADLRGAERRGTARKSSPRSGRPVSTPKSCRPDAARGQAAS